MRISDWSSDVCSAELSPPRSRAIAADRAPGSFDHLAAHQKFGERDRAREAEQRDHERAFEKERAARLNPVGEKQQYPGDVETVHAQHPILRAWASQDAESRAAHRERKQYLRAGTGKGAEKRRHTKLSSNNRS